MKETIKFAGYSQGTDGKIKFRTATNAAPLHQLHLQGEAVDMVEIAPVASKPEAAQELLKLGHAQANTAVQAIYARKAKDAVVAVKAGQVKIAATVDAVAESV